MPLAGHTELDEGEGTCVDRALGAGRTRGEARTGLAWGVPGVVLAARGRTRGGARMGLAWGVPGAVLVARGGRTRVSARMEQGEEGGTSVDHAWVP